MLKNLCNKLFRKKKSIVTIPEQKIEQPILSEEEEQAERDRLLKLSIEDKKNNRIVFKSDWELRRIPKKYKPHESNNN
jgi:hypothetical protein